MLLRAVEEARRPRMPLSVLAWWSVGGADDCFAGVIPLRVYVGAVGPQEHRWARLRPACPAAAGVTGVLDTACRVGAAFLGVLARCGSSVPSWIVRWAQVPLRSPPKCRAAKSIVVAAAFLIASACTVSRET